MYQPDNPVAFKSRQCISQKFDKAPHSMVCQLREAWNFRPKHFSNMLTSKRQRSTAAVRWSA